MCEGRNQARRKNGTIELLMKKSNDTRTMSQSLVSSSDMQIPSRHSRKGALLTNSNGGQRPEESSKLDLRFPRGEDAKVLYIYPQPPNQSIPSPQNPSLLLLHSYINHTRKGHSSNTMNAELLAVHILNPSRDTGLFLWAVPPVHATTLENPKNN